MKVLHPVTSSLLCPHTWFQSFFQIMHHYTYSLLLFSNFQQLPPLHAQILSCVVAKINVLGN